MTIGRPLLDQSHPLARTPLLWWPPLAESDPHWDLAWGASWKLYRLIFPGAPMGHGTVPTVDQLVAHMELDHFLQCYVFRDGVVDARLSLEVVEVT